MKSGTEEPNAPTIIKRKRIVVEDGHHGGAWKVAYADFVTAMMAFFLLMWLLNATTEEQRKGIADYFNPTIPISRISGGGSDGLNGSSIFSEDTYAKMGTGATRRQSVESTGDSKPQDEHSNVQDHEDSFQALKDNLDNSEDRLSEHLLVKMSPEGIVLEITDSDSSPLFQIGQSNPSPILEELLENVSDSLANFENSLRIVGHTDGFRFRTGAQSDNWSLSADRANVARRILISNGISPDRITEIAGRADSEPLIADNPLAAQNRRISITVMTTSSQM